MQARAVRKAALSSVGAVLVTFVVALSVSEHNLPASTLSQDTPAHIEQFIAALQEQVSSDASTEDLKNAASDLLSVVQNPLIQKHHQILADTVLRRLPAGCRNNLKIFSVLYENAKERGLGGKTTIIIDGSVSDSEFAALITHECGHVISGNLLGNVRTGKSAFRDGKDIFAKDSPSAAFFALSWRNEKTFRADANESDFASGYALSNAFEDFAETFTLYVLQRPALEARAKENSVMAAKLNWMRKHLPLKDGALGIPLYSWDGSIPWDATKLAYGWNPVVMNTQN